MDNNHMRIHVDPNGNVEFSVALSDDVDPTLVASMVAAVRRGIVASNPIKSPQSPQQSSRPLSTSSHTTPPDPPTEPTSDPDHDTTRAPDRNCERVPSPILVSAARKLSVRQIAAEIDARPDSLLPNPYNEFDPVREFSSSPALWANPNNPSYVDPDPPKSQSSAYTLRAPITVCDVKPPRRARSPRPIDRIVEQKPAFTTPTHLNQNSSPSRPVRMLSLPSSTNHENINDMYVIRRQSEHTASHNQQDQHTLLRDNTTSLDMIHEREILVEERTTTRQPNLANLPHQNPSSQRSISDLTDSHDLTDPNDLPNPHDVADQHDLDEQRSITPSSPYVQHHPLQEEDPNDAWDNVEYVLTESYRNNPKHSERNDRDSHATPSNSRSAAWRLFSSIGLRRRQDTSEDIHQGTLAAASGYSDKLPKRRRPLFMRNNVRNGTLWMEFTSPLSVERMLAEVGKIAKAMGYQVWRRPGENKLRCIRRLNHRHEMHLVILVGSIRLPEGQVSVIRLRRARGDRNRTEGWRYAHFYREVIDRLQRHGVEISAGE